MAFRDLHHHLCLFDRPEVDLAVARYNVLCRRFTQQRLYARRPYGVAARWRIRANSSIFPERTGLKTFNMSFDGHMRPKRHDEDCG
jgi:hypothetical protein